MTEKSGYEKMLAGEIYANPDWDLIGRLIEARGKRDAFNAMPIGDMEGRAAVLRDLLGSFGESFIVSPVIWEYGKHIHIGDSVFINFDCIFLDGAEIRIGDGTLIGPRAQFLTASHSLDPRERTLFDPATGKRIGGFGVNKPISVGKDCWIGAGALILAGVSIGDGTTIGAGSVVTKSMPAGVLAAGNPCKVIRPIG